jgi:quercetin dioxygenase-like cupin family protein
MEIFRTDDFETLSNSGVTSHQLLHTGNSKSERLTISRVTIVPGARNPAHRHAASEQIWIALRGSGRLLLEGGSTMQFAAGDVVRFADNDLHGFENTGDGEFEYIAVTSPPVNFRAAYAAQWQ